MSPAPRNRKKPAGPYGVPVWRVGKPDAVLAAAVGTAREGILAITAEHYIGAHIAAKSEGERAVTHLFECTMLGYRGWQWFAVLSRAPRAKLATVCEIGLLPSADAVLAPGWVPWAERVLPEDSLNDTGAAGTDESAGAEVGDSPAEDFAEEASES